MLLWVMNLDFAGSGTADPAGADDRRSIYRYVTRCIPLLFALGGWANHAPR